MAQADATSSGTRLTELLGALSLGSDLGMGHPMEHALRQTFLAVRLAERAGIDPAARREVAHSSLLAWVGCHIDAYEQARWFGDDRSMKHDIRTVDLGKPLQSAAFLLGRLGTGRSPLRRLGVGVGYLGQGRHDVDDMLDNHARAAGGLVDQLGLPTAVRESVLQTFERWDGKGDPDGLSGSAVTLTSRLVNLADVTEVFHRAAGLEAAVGVAQARSGTQFDPDLVALFVASAPELFDELGEINAWAAVIDAAAEREAPLSVAEFEGALEAFADFSDLKSPYTVGHSRATARLAGASAEIAGLSAADVGLVRRAGLVHDLGRLGVSNAIWDKPGKLTAAEAERVRLHPYLTERILVSCPGLAPLAPIAAQHHERLDGSGYPRGISGAALSFPALLVATADHYQSRTEPRPHRSALSADEAAAAVRGEVRSGRLDGDAADAVLRAAGQRVRRRSDRPAGLTRREVEVLRLVARGRSHQQIAEQLVISRKTASNHVEHIYAKIGVNNRAMACLFAVKQGLMDEI
jgi:HD-GYP domain-containing protein (c-di-GMP phosphodiesterase class II)